MNNPIPHIETLESQVQNLPGKPGVYIMRNADGDAIYIGKAKSLRTRVRSYMKEGGDGRRQISYLMKKVVSIETVVTLTDEQAYVLERDLITKYKPRYNIRLKDDKQYFRIRIDTNTEWPKIDLVRREEDDGAKYYGPYAMSYELRNLLQVIKKTIPLRSCTDTVLYNRQRPCLEYQIKRCAGPCCLPVDRNQYMDWVKQAIDLIGGKSKKLVLEMNEKMEAASENLRFEEAAAWRDRIHVLEKFDAGHNMVIHHGRSQDVFAVYREDNQAALCILNVRSGRIVDTMLYALPDVAVSNDLILEESIAQYYEGGRDLPGEIVVPLELPNNTLAIDVLSKKRGKDIELIVPERGSRKKLVEIAELNAKQHYIAQVAGDGSWSTVATGLARLLKLSQIPRRIECVDISTFQRTNTVGAVVSFFDGLPDKQNYRKFIIKGPAFDDFASITEVVSRKLARAKKEENLPDLLIIDGGIQQLESALKARDELGITLDIVSLAKMRTASDVVSKDISKKPERIFLEGASEPIDLTLGDPLTNFFQRIRDEVHDYVITFHRKQRSKRVFKSELDDIPGIGVERRIRLLKHFGSVAKIAKSEIEEIARVGKMPKGLAVRVKNAVKK